MSIKSIVSQNSDFEISILLGFTSIGIIFICENSKALHRIFIRMQQLLVHKFFISMGYFFLSLCESWLQIFKNQILGKKGKSKITTSSDASILLLFFSYLKHLYNLMDISVRRKVSFKGKLVQKIIYVNIGCSYL